MSKEKMKVIVLILFVCFTVSSCWSRKELKNLGIIGLIAIDERDETVKIFLEIINPKRAESTSEMNEVTYIESEGKNLAMAMNNTSVKYEKNIYTSHINSYIICEHVARKGINKYIEVYNRYYETRRYVNLSITQDMKVGDVAEIGEKMNHPASLYIESLYENYENNGASVSVKLIDFLTSYYEEGIEPTAGVIKKTEETTGDVPLSVEGLAVFREDKLIDFLNGADTKGYNMVVGKFKKGMYETEMEDFDSVSIEVMEASSGLKVKKKGDEYIGLVEVELGCRLVEVTGEKNVAENREVEKIASKFEEEIELQIEETIMKVQKMESDIFGFGQYIHRKYPREWKGLKDQWNHIFAALALEVKVDIDIEMVGVTNEQIDFK